MCLPLLKVGAHGRLAALSPALCSRSARPGPCDRGSASPPRARRAQPPPGESASPAASPAPALSPRNASARPCVCVEGREILIWDYIQGGGLKKEGKPLPPMRLQQRGPFALMRLNPPPPEGKKTEVSGAQRPRGVVSRGFVAPGESSAFCLQNEAVSIAGRHEIPGPLLCREEGNEAAGGGEVFARRWVNSPQSFSLAARTAQESGVGFVSGH